MCVQANESSFEEATIARLQLLGYRYHYGGDIDRPLNAVILEAPLRSYLARRYPHLPPDALLQAVDAIERAARRHARPAQLQLPAAHPAGTQ